ncbi:hypothetical protein E4K67_14935 [Desulfosporosinus fructosivorans]|uniref:Uncharacterized protein n=1 Tax=Desulfosporosinus fructosivorans TaxID=2018669 RepID=A0A4Z0R263_9FIRM|nr:hypothetical protein E4K67_14935 [Desulfosporosinus fructosivorans]
MPSLLSGNDKYQTAAIVAKYLLNFIHAKHLNKQDFYSARSDTQYFGDREMTFKKEANCLIGHCRVSFKNEDKVIDYLFT